ncbi:MAG TPA: sigma-54 dependent transcriptional regulator [Pyrinomonadaceae bacterium]|jgi:DNA-binding NtrC family response regulator|nr:sigma-54 dependent transcriptional regulator [Pyrinomonadaceae bacterium]
MKTKDRILVVDDESSITDALEMILGEQGYQLSTAKSGREAAELLAGRSFNLVFVDLRLTDITGIELLTRIKHDSPDTEVILMTAYGSVDVTIEAIKKGAYYYLEKPFTPEQVVMLTARALQFAAMQRENVTLKRTLASARETFGIIGRSPQMRRIFETIRATASSDASVLIEGESGTGKELIAAAFHLQSHRAPRPYTRINCAAIPPDLIESELFGYKKGAFTGADRDKRGLIEASDGGTLLLDEIAEMPVHLQTKLLRVLQERKLRRLGDEQEIEVDFRLISSTNRSTSQSVQEGILRKDLYFRISTIKIEVPPLKERPDDLALLVEHFLQRYSKKYYATGHSISPTAHEMLMRYDWPGNVRELESVIERAVLFCREGQLSVEHLPKHIQEAESSPFKCVIPYYMTLAEIEREVIYQTLERTGGNMKKTAQILNLHRPTLYRMLKRMGGDKDPKNVRAPHPLPAVPVSSSDS